MIFKSSDCTFGGITAVDVGQDQLGAAIVGNGLLEGAACFIVHDVECWLAVCSGKSGENVSVRSNAMGNEWTRMALELAWKATMMYWLPLHAHGVKRPVSSEKRRDRGSSWMVMLAPNGATGSMCRCGRGRRAGHR